MKMEKKINSKPLVIVAFLVAILSCRSLNLTAVLVAAVLFFAFAGWLKDQDAAFSTLCALLIILINGLIRLFFNGFEDILNQILTWASANYKAFNAITSIFNVFGFIISLGVIAIAVISIVNIMGGKPANTPLVSSWASRAMGTYVAKPKPQPQYAPAQPVPAPAPEAEPEKPAAEGWTCSCGTVNQGTFCTGCGKRKQ